MLNWLILTEENMFLEHILKIVFQKTDMYYLTKYCKNKFVIII